ncbi:hypothetical protein D3C81_1100040 [compost metagenome]
MLEILVDARHHARHCIGGHYRLLPERQLHRIGQRNRGGGAHRRAEQVRKTVWCEKAWAGRAIDRCPPREPLTGHRKCVEQAEYLLSYACVPVAQGFAIDGLVQA